LGIAGLQTLFFIRELATGGCNRQGQCAVEAQGEQHEKGANALNHLFFSWQCRTTALGRSIGIGGWLNNEPIALGGLRQ
jgi:hypothetical protein